ncbi:carbon-nitrogen hydrolase family protein [Halovenus sp. WSH3]|uniref:Carbon-nitrogen hydrolase family protein n=1 Tax=Halovenus carboxidivorans TaxID=2692199 RepID=A0A6B0T4U2_9EURY|nr:carbon-nitrogen hydrolase family protein [Halovenus carboxidivorans]MXR50543.1 carbon-nitrogen hydrolase family protein [Halovenus carboxidivorans]
MPAESFTLGAAQIEPVYHDKEATLDKTCRYIEQAGAEGVDLLVFPETYFPGYPYWRGSVSIPRWTDLMVDLQKNSLHVEDEAVEILGAAAAEADLHVALGTNELSDRGGSETIYNSIFYFGRDGDLLGRHRKLMPTHEERAIWGRGDPSSLETYETDIGQLGGLICFENHMTLSKAALTAMGEEIHAAVWPGFWEQHGHPGDKSRAETAEAVDTCDIYPAMREYAFETQSFVAACSAYMSEDVPEGFSEEELGFNVAAGGSMLINPAGIVEAGPLIDEEGLLTAEFERDERRATKAYFDAMGHYTRWDAVSLSISDETLEPAQQRGDTAQGRGDGGLSAATAQRLAEEHDVAIEAVEEIAEAVAGRQ